MNKCIICGKMFEPYRCKGKKQLTCSEECRKAYAKQYYREHGVNKEKQKEAIQRQREAKNGHVICRICGKPVFRTFAVGEGQPWMHEECVFNDCIETVVCGQTLSGKQRQRLDRRGYSISEFIEEFEDEIERRKKVHA